MFQAAPAVKGRPAVRPGDERQRLGDQAEVRQPLLLQGVHTGRVLDRAHPGGVKSDSASSLTVPGLCFRLRRTTDIMFGGKQVVVCGYGEVSEMMNLSRMTNL